MWGDDKSLIRVPPVRCDRCGRDAIMFQRYSGNHFCEDHFQRDLLARAKRTIRARGWIRSGDRVAIGLSGGWSSGSLLHFFSAQFGMRPDLSLVALTIDDGNLPARDMERIRDIAGGLGIEWVSAFPEQVSGGHPDGILHALAPLAVRIGATKLALGTNLDDIAGSVLLQVLRGKGGRLFDRSPPDAGGIPVIEPFVEIPLEELRLYARLNVTGAGPGRRPHALDPLESEVARFLGDYTDRHPSTPFALARLPERLADAEGSRPRALRPSRGRGGRDGPGCAERGTRGRVTGHG
jgi:2-thiouridine synthetase TtuA, N-terminal LIM domain